MNTKTNSLLELTGFAALLNDIVEGAETIEERDHLYEVIDRIRAGHPTTAQTDAQAVLAGV